MLRTFVCLIVVFPPSHLFPVHLVSFTGSRVIEARMRSLIVVDIIYFRYSTASIKHPNKVFIIQPFCLQYTVDTLSYGVFSRISGFEITSFTKSICCSEIFPLMKHEAMAVLNAPA